MNHRIGAILSAVFVLALARGALAAESVPVRPVLDKYCLDCHDADAAKGGLNLEPLVADDVARDPGTWEKVVRRMRGHQMPPAGKKRPEDRKSTRLNSSHSQISYAVFCLKKKSGRNRHA